MDSATGECNFYANPFGYNWGSMATTEYQGIMFQFDGGVSNSMKELVFDIRKAGYDPEAGIK